jgi:hypothetical protein
VSRREVGDSLACEPCVFIHALMGGVIAVRLAD